MFSKLFSLIAFSTILAACSTLEPQAPHSDCVSVCRDQERQCRPSQKGVVCDNDYAACMNRCPASH